MGYADPPLGTAEHAGSKSRDSKDSRFSASDIDRANQKCAFNSRVRGEGRGEGGPPRVVAHPGSRGNPAPLTPTLSPRKSGYSIHTSQNPILRQWVTRTRPLGQPRTPDPSQGIRKTHVFPLRISTERIKSVHSTAARGERERERRAPLTESASF